MANPDAVCRARRAAARQRSEQAPSPNCAGLLQAPRCTPVPPRGPRTHGAVPSFTTPRTTLLGGQHGAGSRLSSRRTARHRRRQTRGPRACFDGPARPATTATQAARACASRATYRKLIRGAKALRCARSSHSSRSAGEKARSPMMRSCTRWWEVGGGSWSRAAPCVRPACALRPAGPALIACSAHRRCMRKCAMPALASYRRSIGMERKDSVGASSSIHAPDARPGGRPGQAKGCSAGWGRRHMWHVGCMLWAALAALCRPVTQGQRWLARPHAGTQGAAWRTPVFRPGPSAVQGCRVQYCLLRPCPNPNT